MKTAYHLYCSLCYRLFVLTNLLLVSYVCYGQYQSNGNGFQVDNIKGCAPLTVTVSDDLGDEPRVYNFNWDGDIRNIIVDPDQVVINPDTTYTEPGIYTILQVTDGGDTSTINIEVLEPLPPTYQVFNCINNTVYLDFSQENYYDRVLIDFGGGSFETVDLSDRQHTVYTFSPGEHTISVQGFFDNAEANCGQRDTTIRTINELSVAAIAQVQVLDENSIALDYTLPNSDISYRLEVAENGSDNFTFAAYDIDASAASLTIDDLPDTRENYYCFRIASVNRCDEELNLYSDTLCSIALQATAGNQVNNLSWQTYTADFGTYQLVRDETPLAETQQTTYEDASVVCRQAYTYLVAAQKDDMRSISELLSLTTVSTEVLTAAAGFDLSVQGLSFVLSWDAVPEAEQYYIYRESSGMPLQKFDSLSDASTYTDWQVEKQSEYCYQLSYVDACGNESELSAPLCGILPEQGKVVFPNAFTPNGDGLNDVFLYKGNLIEEIELQIFNRWGEMLFHTNEKDTGWDGSYRGAALPEGVYIYRARVLDQLGNTFEMRGSFTLLLPGR